MAQIKWKSRQEYLSEQLEKAKASKIAQSKEELEKFFANHPLLFKDNNYYSVTQEKQSLLNSALTLYNLKIQSEQEAVFKWNATGERCIDMSIEDGCELAIAIGNYVEPYVSHQQDIELQIKGCNTMKELEAVVIDYEAIN